MAESRKAAEQDQFLDVIDRDEAERRLHAAIDLRPIGAETVMLEVALGRILATDVIANVDVPSFDRSNLDGFAVRAADTFGANEEHPKKLRLNAEVIATAVVPRTQIEDGYASTIATGGMLPRGADAIVMVEHTELDGDDVLVRKPVTAGFGVTYAGTDVAQGETVLRQGQRLSSRDTGVLAAIGESTIEVYRLPTVAIISTGDEIIPPGEPMRPGLVYDSNARIIADATTEAGGQPEFIGVVRDDVDELRHLIRQSVERFDVVLLSGGTSKGAGDISYRVVNELGDPGIVAHGVALKPGKPICMAATEGKPVIVLPGFPTSAIFTFHEFVVPIIHRLAGATIRDKSQLRARLAVKVNSTIGRTEFLLVGLVEVPDSQQQLKYAAYPMGKGSGSVTTFSHADGFVRIARNEEIVDAGSIVNVTLLGNEIRPADLVVVGSHCVGLDLLLRRIHKLGFSLKCIAVGSTAGLQAVEREECDVAGIHLLDEKSGRYNAPFLSDSVELLPGYGRQQGVLFREGDSRFDGKAASAAISVVKHDASCAMVNRNRGSGTRILIDQLLGGTQPSGYAVQARSHNAVAAAVVQGRADWGVAIEPVARRSGLGFLPVGPEQFDFVVPKSRRDRPAVRALSRLLEDTDVRAQLRERGFDCP